MLHKTIKEIENKWLQILYEYLKAEFKKTWLPSHDETHHYRVWQYCKELVNHLKNNGYPFSRQKIEQLIIAVFFHDLGLTRTYDSSHGRVSRDLCMQFLKNFPALGENFIKPILTAIEQHDDKSYISLKSDNRLIKTGLHSILALSDDLDAFGPVGVYRYIEIYYLRKIKIQEMPSQIIENLNSRFSFLLWLCSDMEDMIQKHNKRFLYTVNFFGNMNTQLKSGTNKNTSEGPLGVYNLIIEETRKKHIHFTKLPVIYDNLPDIYCKDYINHLQEELNNFTN